MTIQLVIKKLFLGLALLISTCGLTYAAEAESQSSNERDNKQKNERAEERTNAQPKPGPQSTTSAGAPTKQDKKDGGDIFQPSEEISEDFAVSFPVDI